MFSLPIRNPYPSLALAGLVEGPLTGIACGVGWSLGWIDPLVAFALIWVGALFQDLVFFGLGRFAARAPKVRAFITRKRLLREGLAPLASSWRREMFVTVLLTKLSYGVYAPVVVTGGLAGAPFRRFIVYSCAIEAPLDVIWLGLGFGLQRLYGAAGAHASQIITAMGLVALALLVFLFRHARRQLDQRCARETLLAP
jgi:membrane protein DedA with SNARE-associated domain